MTLSRYKRLFKCDTARISRFPDKLFLIIGWNEKSENECFETTVDGTLLPLIFSYVSEKIIASGRNEKELEVSARHYKKLCGMSWTEYFKLENKKERP